MANEFTPVVKIEQAFLQLNFTIKLLPYFENRKIRKIEFDQRHEIKLERRTLVLVENMFHTEEDLISAAYNNYMMAFGFTAIVMDTALQALGIKGDPRGGNQAKVAELVRLIRCAFAHDVIHPVWKIDRNSPDEMAMQLNGEVVEIKLKDLKNRPFHSDALHGMENYFKLRDTVLAIAREVSPK